MVLAWKKAQRFEASTLYADRRGLRAFAERLGEGKEQRDHRDQERDLLVLFGRNVSRMMLGVLDLRSCARPP